MLMEIRKLTFFERLFTYVKLIKFFAQLFFNVRRRILDGASIHMIDKEGEYVIKH